ncbi:PAS domain S-box protein [Methanoregula sp.]|uniref:PAS domain S-box protein n=1 Tax=Methanoregula sp. TaxID=2052170 RepID=UPI0035618C91
MAQKGEQCMMPDAIRVLYTDDEPVLLDLARLFLEKDGAFAVDTCTSAGQALVRLRTENYDVIISDYQMPEMDGIAFLKHLRASGDTTPFIIFTGRGREEVVIEAFNEGADFYLQKGGAPRAQFAELAHKIRHALSRTQAIKALKKSEHDYRHLIEHASQAIYVVQDTLLRMVNPHLAELTGYSEQELISMPYSTFIHPDDRAMVADRYERRLRGEDVPPKYTFRLYRKDKTARWVELSVVIITWDDRPAVLVFLNDINERKLAEDALRESEERYRQFFKTTLDCVFITTPGGQWIDFNDALVEMFGYESREEMFRVPVPSIYADPAERPVFLKDVERDGYVKERPLRFRKRDGTVFDSLITIVPVKNPDGSTKMFIGTFRDVTENKRVEEALRESEIQYRHIFGSFEDLYYQTDVSGVITLLSPSLNRLTGWMPEELLGKPATVLYVNPHERTALIDEITTKGYVRDYELLLRKRDGTETPASLSANRIFHADGTEAGVAGILRDITERKRAETGLKESEEKFRSLVEYSLEAILIIDLEGKILFANNAAAKTVELGSCADMTGRNVMEFIAPESQNDVITDFARVAEGHDAYIAHYAVITAKGNRISVESIGKIVTYEGIPADLISIRDVTAKTQDRAGSAGREPFDPKRAENLLDYIVVYGDDGKILYVNPAAERALGYAAGEMAGTALTSYIAEESHGKVSSGMAALQDVPEVPLTEIELLSRDGLHRSVIAKGKPVRYENRPATLLFLIDITRKKVLEDQLTARANELLRISAALQQANKQLTLLSSITRHDINNQLTVLTGFLSLLEPDLPDPRLADYCRKAGNAAERIAAMIRFAREYETIGAQAPVWQDLRAVVDTGAGNAPLGKVRVMNDLPAGVEVLADPLIVKVMYNLMDNAARYGGKITTIRFSLRESDTACTLICEDDGNGVAAFEKEKIFERGFGKNTGLGLAISREILAITGITIHETGVPGKGARFEIEVPKDMWRSRAKGG